MPYRTLPIDNNKQISVLNTAYNRTYDVHLKESLNEKFGFKKS